MQIKGSAGELIELTITSNDFDSKLCNRCCHLANSTTLHFVNGINGTIAMCQLP